MPIRGEYGAAWRGAETRPVLSHLLRRERSYFCFSLSCPPPFPAAYTYAMPHNNPLSSLHGASLFLCLSFFFLYPGLPFTLPSHIFIRIVRRPRPFNLFSLAFLFLSYGRYSLFSRFYSTYYTLRCLTDKEMGARGRIYSDYKNRACS